MRCWCCTAPWAAVHGKACDALVITGYPAAHCMRCYSMLLTYCIMLLTCLVCSHATALKQKSPHRSGGCSACAKQCVGKIGFSCCCQHHPNAFIDLCWLGMPAPSFCQAPLLLCVFAAAALVTKSNLAAANELLQSATFSNPHSRSACGIKTTQALDEATQLVLRFFNADPKRYTVIWTS